MQFALGENGKRVEIHDAVKKNKYFCPCCNEKLILKQGRVKMWHYCHKADSVCTVDNDMCEWHLRMQGYFSPEYREVVVDKKHRADVLKDGIVIEFQHSPISLDDFEDRNNYYIGKGYSVCWVFDTTDWFDKGKLDEVGIPEGVYRLKRAPSVLQEYNFSNPNLSICFCDSYKDEDTGEISDTVFRVNGEYDRWRYISFNEGSCSLRLSDSLDLRMLFFSEDDWINYLLDKRGYTVRAVQCEGHNLKLPRPCTGHTGMCQFCKFCELLEHQGYSVIAYCSGSSGYSDRLDEEIIKEPDVIYNAFEQLRRV